MVMEYKVYIEFGLGFLPHFVEFTPNFCVP